MIEARSVFRRRRSHRVEGYVVLSAMRRRAACGRPVSAVFTAVGRCEPLNVVANRLDPCGPHGIRAAWLLSPGSPDALQTARG